MRGGVMFLAQSIPTHDTDVFLYAVGGIALLLLGAFLIRYANRKKGP
jgi:hypothetical protein